jgi:hypothetical protein
MKGKPIKAVLRAFGDIRRYKDGVGGADRITDKNILASCDQVMGILDEYPDLYELNLIRRAIAKV